MTELDTTTEEASRATAPAGQIAGHGAGRGPRGVRLVAFGILLALFLVAVASAQERNDFQKPEHMAYADDSCLRQQVNSLRAATELSLSLEEQEKRLNAAQAYEKLGELMQPC